jgi:hypothetical protein
MPMHCQLNADLLTISCLVHTMTCLVNWACAHKIHHLKAPAVCGRGPCRYPECMAAKYFEMSLPHSFWSYLYAYEINPSAAQLLAGMLIAGILPGQSLLII